MKKTLLILIAIFFVTSFGFSQKDIIKIKKFNPKNSIWVMDVMKSYTGQGATGWDFDYTEVVQSRNSHGLATLIETSEKIEGTASWRNKYHAEIAYFDNDTTSEYKLNEWNISGNNWVSDYSYYETKDEDGKLIIHYERGWDDTYQTFTQGNKEIYTYDVGGLKTIKEDRDWNNNTWEEYSKTYFSYDGNNNCIEELEKRYISSGVWRDNWKTQYTYNAENKKLTEQQWGYDSYWEEWFDYSKTTYTYYDNGLIQEEFTEKYDYDNSQWYDLAKTKYYYLANGLLEYKEELDLQEPDNNLKYEYTYNADNQETSFFLYSWNGSDWTRFYKVYDNYDTNGNQIDFYSQLLDGTWNNFQKEEYTWNEFATDVSNIKINEVNIYPNPASDIININLDTEKIFSCEIVDIYGKIVLKSNTKKVVISKLPASVYFIRVNNQKVAKFIKE